jgi:6-phosphogluconolactonase
VFSIDSTTGALNEVSCVSTAGTSGCTQSVSATDAESLTLSPDGHTLYESSYDGSAISAFSVDSTTGALTQISGAAGCVSSSALGSCQVDSQMTCPGPVVISPDGAWLRVATYNNSSLLAYPIAAGGGLGARATDGAGCVQDGTGTTSCPNLSPLGGAYDIASSPDGNRPYVGLFNANGVSALSTPSGSAPTLIECALEPPGTSPCNTGAGLDTVNSVVAAPDGHAVYFADEGNGSTGSGDPTGAVAAFQRDPSTGALSQYAGAAGCQLSSPPMSGAEASCGADPMANGPYAIAVTPDSNFVYAMGLDHRRHAHDRGAGSRPSRRWRVRTANAPSQESQALHPHGHAQRPNRAERRRA